MCVFLEMQSLYLYFKIFTCGANYVQYAYIDYGTKFTIAPFKKRKEKAYHCFFVIIDVLDLHVLRE